MGSWGKAKVVPKVLSGCSTLMNVYSSVGTRSYGNVRTLRKEIWRSDFVKLALLSKVSMQQASTM